MCSLWTGDDRAVFQPARRFRARVHNTNLPDGAAGRTGDRARGASRSDAVARHVKWIAGVNDTQQTNLVLPIVAPDKNFHVIDTFQTADKYRIVMPSDWGHGADVILPRSVLMPVQTRRSGTGFVTLRPQLRTVELWFDGNRMNRNLFCVASVCLLASLAMAQNLCGRNCVEHRDLGENGLLDPSKDAVFIEMRAADMESNAGGHGGGGGWMQEGMSMWLIDLNADGAVPLKEMIVTSGAWVPLIDRDFHGINTASFRWNTSLQKSWQ